MNNIEMAKAYLRQAEARIRTAERALKEGNYPYSVRQAQEAVELSLKAVLRLVGIEPPKWHDVGPILRKNRNRFPNWFRELIDELAFISRQLRREREVSMYGDEEMGIPPN
ncbi:MAG: HEPN domain-containing protein, partial [Candidatus Njordarchaeales archaeon]